MRASYGPQRRLSSLCGRVIVRRRDDLRLPLRMTRLGLKAHGYPRAMLHVTNGDSTLEVMRGARLGGEAIAWRDVLHEGPVTARDAAGLRAERAAYLSRWQERAEVDAALRERDERLERAVAEGEPVVLWFEHDLYDQLQLAQILTRLPDRPAAVELICVGTFPGRPDFKGLGELSPDDLASLWPVRTPVTVGHVRAARGAWEAFRGDDPRALARAAASPDERLPFLAPALGRLLEEYPGARDGLARTERQLLAAIDGGASGFAAAFVAAHEAEEAPFLGDLTAFERLHELAGGAHPLVSGRLEPPGDVPQAGGGGFAQAEPEPPGDVPRAGRFAAAGEPLRLTEAGRAVLAGEADRVELAGFDRWIGGVHLGAGEALWRWDGTRREVVRR